jgi:hypothetical protein
MLFYVFFKKCKDNNFKLLRLPSAANKWENTQIHLDEKLFFVAVT